MKYINTNKLEEIKIKDDNYYVVLDFDKTITSKNSIDSWGAVIDFEIYGEECKKEIEELNAKYEPIETDYTIEEKQKEQYMVEWYQKSMDLLERYKLTYSNLQKALEKDKLEFRKGAKEFFKRLKEKNIPLIILSAGIGNVIEEFLKKEGCYFTNIHIISNFIEFKEDKMQKFTGTIIHSMNKRIEGSLPEDLQNRINQKQYAILCGDIIEDTKMIGETKDEVITIGFLNKKIEENLQVYNQNYDIILTEEDATFYEVEKIIKERKGEI